MKTFYFTATGNSLAVAKRIGGELISIAKADKKEYKDDVIGVVFPVYGFAVPKIVRRFLAETKLDADYMFAVGTYGNMAGAASEDIRRLGGFDYVNTVLMVDNYLPIFDIVKQRKKAQMKDVDERIEKIAKDIRERKRFAPKVGVFGRYITGLCSVINIEPEDNAKRYYTVDNDVCVRCGICAEVCPTGNIEIKDKVVFGGGCACCLACVHACPQRAIHVKRERSSERWRNPDVTLREIIEANNQNE